MGLGRSVTTTLVCLGLVVLATAAMASPAGQTRFLPIDIATHARPDQVTVRTGDHLWKISRAHLEAELGRAVSNSEVTPYWREVIDANLEHLRSGDPDLIYPGETVFLPGDD
jgi:nucleoid-associated protein YgaU